MKKNRFIQALSGKKTTLILLVMYAVLMAIATIIEKFHGTPVAKGLIYYSPLFLLLQLLMILNFIGVTVRNNLTHWKKGSYLIIHLSFATILSGAFLTHLMGKEGILHLREGEKSHLLIVQKDGTQVTEELPFEVELTDFKLVRYPGSQSPSSYESYLKIYIDKEVREEKIYMNNVLDLKGYRLFQASYDPDEKGSILSVNHDAIGRNITYTGYTLLFIGLLGMLFDKHSRFRRLWKQLKYGSFAILCLCLQGMGTEVNAQEIVISRSHAKAFGTLPMQSANGRIIPINTFASEIVRKFKAKEVIGGLTPDQFLLSVLTYSADWALIPLFEVKEEELSHRYGWKEGRIAYRDAFDERGDYMLSAVIEKIYRKNPSERTRTDKELLKIDDRINIFHELLSNRMLRIFPSKQDTIHYRWAASGEVMTVDSARLSKEAIQILALSNQYLLKVKEASQTHQWTKADSLLNEIKEYQLQNCQGSLIKTQKLEAEVFYNDMNLHRICRMGYLILGGFLILLTLRTGGILHAMPKWEKTLQKTLLCGTFFFFLLHTLNLGLRWYISGYAPWSNSYETMVALSWAGVLCGFVFVNRNRLVTSLATLFGGIILFVSGLNWMDPQITPLVPVLKSPWLMAHVASLVMAYGFLGISCMIGTAYLLLCRTQKETTHKMLSQLTIINELSMTLGLSLLAVGIFLGAIWANESWGRYWSWDPKETWALITMVIYTGVLHYQWFKKGNDNKLFNLLSQWSVLSILMTFLGVNYFLSGMHSYGSHDALSAIPVWAYLIFGLFFIVPAVWAYGHAKKR